MSHTDDGPLASYNSLLDPHLTGYFSNTRIRRHLRKSGLVTKRGSVVTETQYRLNAARKEHRKQVRELLATAIVSRTLDIERQRQSVIKRKLEEIAKVELVKRVKAEREKQKDAALLPLLSPKTGRQWPYLTATDAAVDTGADAPLAAGGPRPPRERRGSAPTLVATSAGSAAILRPRLYEPRPHTAGPFDDGHSPLFASTSGEPAAANVSVVDAARPMSAESSRSLTGLDLDASDRRTAFADVGATAGSEGGDVDDGRLAAASPLHSDDGSGARSVAAARGRRQVTSVDADGYPVLRRRDDASATAPTNVTPRPHAAAAAICGANSSSEPSPQPVPPPPPPRMESSLSSETQRDGRTISPRRPRRRHFGGSAAVEGGHGVGNPVHPLLTVSSEPIDTRHLWALDRTSLEKYNELLEREQLGRLLSPYRENLAAAGVAEPPPPAASLQQPHPPAGPRRVPALQRRVVLPRDKGNSRAEGAAAERSSTAGLLMLHRLGPAFKEQELVQSFCEVTLRFFGAHPHPDRRRSAAAASAATAASALDLRQEVLVEQQHCGGSTLVVFRALLLPKKDFVIISRRHRGYPFSLTFFVDGLLDARVSACCEYKHQSGYRLGGKSGHFGIVSVKGSAPCYKCQVERGLHISSAPPQPKWRFGGKAIKGQHKPTDAAASDTADQNANVSSEQLPQVADSRMKNNRDDFESEKDAAAERVTLGSSDDSPAETKAGDDTQPSGQEFGTADKTADQQVQADIRPVVTSDDAAMAPPEDGASTMQLNGARSADSGRAESDVEHNPADGGAEETAATPVAAPLAYEDDFEEEPVEQGSERLATTTARVPASDMEETERVMSPRLPVDRGPTTDNELTALTAALATSAPPRSRTSSVSSSASTSSSLSTSASSAFMSSTDSLESLVTSSLLGLASLASEQRSPPDVARVDSDFARPNSAEPTSTPLLPPPETSTVAAAAADKHEVAVASSNASDDLPSPAKSSQSPDANRAASRSDDEEPEVFITQLHDGSPVVDGSVVQLDASDRRDSSPPAASVHANVGSGMEMPAAHESELRSASPVRKQIAGDGGPAPEEQNETGVIEKKEEPQAEGDEKVQADGENDDISDSAKSQARSSGEPRLVPESSAPDMEHQAEGWAATETNKAHADGDASRSEATDAPLRDRYSPVTKPEDIDDPGMTGDGGEHFDRGERSTDDPPKEDSASAAVRRMSDERLSPATASLALVDRTDDNNYNDDAEAQSPGREPPGDRSVDDGPAAIVGASTEAPSGFPLSTNRGHSPSPMVADSQRSTASRSDRERPGSGGSLGGRTSSPGGGSTSAASENETVDGQVSDVDAKAALDDAASDVDAKAALDEAALQPLPLLTADDREWGPAPDARSADAVPPEALQQEHASSAEVRVAHGDVPAPQLPEADARAALPITISLTPDESYRPVDDGTENVNDATLGSESSSVLEMKSVAAPLSPSSLVVPASPFVDLKASFPYTTAGLARPSTTEADLEGRVAAEQLTVENESTATVTAAPSAEQRESPAEREVDSGAVQVPVWLDSDPLETRHDLRHDVDQRELHPRLPETASHPGEYAQQARQTSSDGRAATADQLQVLQLTAVADLSDSPGRQSPIELARPPTSESPAEGASVPANAASLDHASANHPIATSIDSDGSTASTDERQSNAEVAVPVLEPPLGAAAATSVVSINLVPPNHLADRVVAAVDDYLDQQRVDVRNTEDSEATVATTGDPTEPPGSDSVSRFPDDSGGASRSSDSATIVTTQSAAAAEVSVNYFVPVDSHVIINTTRRDVNGLETSMHDTTEEGAQDARHDATDDGGDQSSLGDSLASAYDVDASRSEPAPPPRAPPLDDQPEIKGIEHSNGASPKVKTEAVAVGTGDKTPEQQPVPAQPQQHELQPRIGNDYEVEQRPLSGDTGSSSPPFDDYSVTETHFESYHSSPGGGDDGRRHAGDGGDAASAAEPAFAADGGRDPEPAVRAESVAVATATAARPERYDAADGGSGTSEKGAAVSHEGADGGGVDYGFRHVLEAPEDGSRGGGDDGVGGRLAKEEQNATERADVGMADEAKSIATVNDPLSAAPRLEEAGSGGEDS